MSRIESELFRSKVTTAEAAASMPRHRWKAKRIVFMMWQCWFEFVPDRTPPASPPAASMSQRTVTCP